MSNQTQNPNDANPWAAMIGPLRGFMRKRVRDEHTADDLAQDVLLKAQAALATAPAEEKFDAWMFQIARNTLIDFYRSPRNKGHTPLEQAVETPAPAGVDEAAGLTDCVRQIIQRLPQPYRSALEMADLEGLSQQDIADRAGISLSGAKSRVQRAREQLREMILDCCNLERDARGNIVDCRTTERTARYCGPEQKPGCGE